MATYTLLLQRPDYISDNYGLDTYLTTVEEDSVQHAADAARLEAAACDGCEPEAAIDYAVLICIAGEHNDLSYLIDNEGV